MRIVRLSIQNFRGIRSLNWDPPSGLVCLIGSGDSGKTTILDAITLALFPRNWFQISESDFYRGIIEGLIEIEVTVADLPPILLSDSKYGLEVRGWSLDGQIQAEPENDDTPVLTVRLRIDESLEPAWHVINDRNPEGRMISAADRATIGVVRLDENTALQLSWGRSSSLRRITGIADLDEVLNSAQRTAREAIGTMQFSDLQEIAEQAGEWGKIYGSYADLPLKVGLDININAGALHLKQAEGIAAGNLGMGSRRLLSLAIQQQISESLVTLVDEIEGGLEPHRLRHMVNKLQKLQHQVIFTTHSTIAVAEIGAEGIAVVQKDRDGIVKIYHPDKNLQGTIRSVPEALLGRRVIVCEGKTEYGIARGLIDHWDKLEKYPLSMLGTVFVDGEGSLAPGKAMNLKKLGFSCIYWSDSDVQTNPSIDDLESEGIDTIVWDGETNTEQRLMRDVSEKILEKLWEIAVSEKGEDAISAHLANELGLDHGRRPKSWREWCDTYSLDQLRKPLGDAAHKKNWYKTITVGRKIGEAIAEDVDSFETTDLAQKIRKLRKLAYGD